MNNRLNPKVSKAVWTKPKIESELTIQNTLGASGTGPDLGGKLSV